MFDSKGHVDFTSIRCNMTDREIQLKLVQVAELNETEFEGNRSGIKELRSVCLKRGNMLTLTIHFDGSLDMYWNC